MPARAHMTCTLDDCKRPHYGTGLCRLHYLRRYRTGSTGLKHRRVVYCSVDGCTRRVKGRGLCHAHYARWYNGSSNDGPISLHPGTPPRGDIPSDRTRDEWLAYLAGFFDGEGCISIVRRNTESSRSYYLSIAAAQIDAGPLLVFKAMFGGTVKRHGQMTNRPVYQWVATCRQAANAIRELAPRLMVKREQADAALQFQDTMTSDHKVTDAILAERERLCMVMTAAKHRRHD